jgi:hypothetical protein
MKENCINDFDDDYQFLGVPSLSCLYQPEKEFVNTTQMFVPVYSLQETTADCAEKCMENLSKCFGYYYESNENEMVCSLIHHHNVSRYKRQPGNIQGLMNVCWNGKILIFTLSPDMCVLRHLKLKYSLTENISYSWQNLAIDI